MHAVASLLPVPTCTCGLTFASADLLSAHIAANVGSSSSSSSGTTTPAVPAAAADSRPYAAICQTSGCGHPMIAHGDRGPRCRIMLHASGRYCPCTAFT